VPRSKWVRREAGAARQRRLKKQPQKIHRIGLGLHSIANYHCALSQHLGNRDARNKVTNTHVCTQGEAAHILMQLERRSSNMSMLEEHGTLI